MYLIIDIGATYTKYAYYNKQFHCLKKDKFPTIKTNKKDFYQSIIQLDNSQIEAISISMSGLINSKKGYIEAITLLPFLKQTPIIDELQQFISKPIYIENDAKCAALGEMWQGHLKNIENGLFVVLGSGIGGTIILNHQIYTSPRHKAGEIGSLLLPLDTKYHHITNLGRHNNANNLIHQLSMIMQCQENGKIVFDLLPNHPQGLDFLHNYCKEIAIALYNLDYILDLDVICIGGGISEQPLLIQTLQEEFKQLRNQYKEDEHEPYITHCKHYNDANLLGALSLINKAIH